MNSVTAVLLALVLIVVVLLIVWLVLRSRSSDVPRESASSGPGAYGAAVSGLNRVPGPGPVDPRGADAAAAAEAEDRDGPDAVDARGDDDVVGGDADRTAEPPGAGTGESPGNEGAVIAEEFVDPGLSELDAQTSGYGGGDAAGGADDGALSGTPPRTPAEAFGSSHASADADDHWAASGETSALDVPDADSTPLFKSIREELMGSAAADGTEQSPEAEPVGTALADDVVAEHPQVESAWSETLTEGVVETGAVGAGSDGSAEEDELFGSNEETGVDVAGPGAGPGPVGHPPVPRISELHEVVDGGFGIGSAATLADGAQPLGHPIKANVDTKTYQDLHSPWYDETEPDVWFLDPGFAERAGFRRAE
jgi:hypothetical protein